MIFEKKNLIWPKRLKEDGTLNQFTKKDILELNKKDGKYKVSHVTVHAKVNALIKLGVLEEVKAEKTTGRPVKIYQFVGYYNPTPDGNNGESSITK